MNEPTYEQRGTMIYIEETPDKPAEYLGECGTVDETEEIVRRLNYLTEIANSGSGTYDVLGS